MIFFFIARRSILLDTQHPDGLEKIRELEAQGRPARLEVEEPPVTPPRFITELRVKILQQFSPLDSRSIFIESQIYQIIYYKILYTRYLVCCKIFNFQSIFYWIICLEIQICNIIIYQLLFTKQKYL